MTHSICTKNCTFKMARPGRNLLKADGPGRVTGTQRYRLKSRTPTSSRIDKSRARSCATQSARGGTVPAEGDSSHTRPTSWPCTLSSLEAKKEPAYILVRPQVSWSESPRCQATCTHGQDMLLSAGYPLLPLAPWPTPSREKPLASTVPLKPLATASHLLA